MADAHGKGRSCGRSCFQQTGWFVLLWLLGVSGAVLLALPFRLLVAMAMAGAR